MNTITAFDIEIRMVNMERERKNLNLIITILEQHVIELLSYPEAGDARVSAEKTKLLVENRIKSIDQSLATDSRLLQHRDFQS